MTEARNRIRRRKIPLACEPCRDRKSRCDGAKLIYMTCQRRGLSLDHCVYNTDNARTASKDSYIKTLHDRIHALEQSLGKHGIPVPLFSCETATLPSSRNADLGLSVGSSQDSTENLEPSRNIVQDSSGITPLPHEFTPAASPIQQDSADAESCITAMGTIGLKDDVDTTFEASEGFYGSSSVASFIQEAMATAKSPGSIAPQDVSSPLNSSGLPHERRRLRRADIGYTHAERFSLPPRSLADHLLSRFWEKMFYIYPIFHRPAFERAYETIWKPRNELEPEPSFAYGIQTQNNLTWVLVDIPCAAELTVPLKEANVIYPIPSLQRCSKSNRRESSSNTCELAVRICDSFSGAIFNMCSVDYC
ncbi:hypothetical protein F4677DRAFT_427816 [Hypoxylon crocopeplum]|nr:hypothetical protein F4677DRAFT_427816 [Hypoxylon crocopeplum]